VTRHRSAPSATAARNLAASPARCRSARQSQVVLDRVAEASEGHDSRDVRLVPFAVHVSRINNEPGRSFVPGAARPEVPRRPARAAERRAPVGVHASPRLRRCKQGVPTIQDANSGASSEVRAQRRELVGVQVTPTIQNEAGGGWRLSHAGEPSVHRTSWPLR
jgi:hypothetical protein